MEFPNIEHLKKIEVTGLPITDDPAEIAWLIAIIEGEGYFSEPKASHANGSKYYNPFRVRVVMCDLDVVTMVQKYSGASYILGPVEPHKNSLGKKPYYIVNIENARAYFLLKAGWKWLGERRRKRAVDCIVKWSTIVSQNEGTVLNATKAAEIRRRLVGGATSRSLAIEYGVTDAMISRIKLNQAWRTST